MKISKHMHSKIKKELKERAINKQIYLYSFSLLYERLRNVAQDNNIMLEDVLEYFGYTRTFDKSNYLKSIKKKIRR